MIFADIRELVKLLAEFVPMDLRILWLFPTHEQRNYWLGCMVHRYIQMLQLTIFFLTYRRGRKVTA